MRRAMIAVLVTLCLLAVGIGMGPAAGGVPVAANPAGAGPAASGSATSVLHEDFEGAFPGSRWLVGDMGVGSGADYWGAAWLTEGTNSPNMDQPNFSIRQYDYNMDTFMHLAWPSAVDVSAWDLAYLDFWAWCQTEENADYLSLEWYDEGSGAWVNTGSGQQITGTSDWTRHYWKTPCRYMTSGALFGFLFHSDFSEIGEGVYVDDINLMQADVTVEPDSYADATA